MLLLFGSISLVGSLLFSSSRVNNEIQHYTIAPRELVESISPSFAGWAFVSQDYVLIVDTPTKSIKDME